MQKSFEKLYKIFKLEAEFGYTNKAVVGGIEQLTATWQGEARAEGVPEETIKKVSTTLNQYPELTIPDRIQALKKVGQILDIPGIKYLQEAKVENESQPQPNPNADRKINTSIQNGQKRESRISTQNRQNGMPAPVPNIPESGGLEQPVTEVRGIGQKQSQLLAKLGIHTIEDMLYYFPRRYDDYSELKLIKDLNYGEEATIIAWVKSITTFTTKNKNRKVIQVVVSDDTGSIQLLWFNQEYHLRYFRKNMFLSISGKIEQYMGRLVMYHPDYEQVEQEQLSTNRIVPVYALTARLSQKWLRRAIYNVVNNWAPKIPEYMTEYILEDADLMVLSTALKEIHFPENVNNLKKARYRLAFDEIFLLQLGVLRQKFDWVRQESRQYSVTEDWFQNQINQLDYELTTAQKNALTDIRQDLSSGRPMNRLLQGDVGSGKTVVAALGAGIVIKNGAQGAIMAPTSILAEQHYFSLKRLLANPNHPDPVLNPDEIRLLIGDTPAKARHEILAGVANGSIRLLIGTHALIEDPVVFENLQIIIVDEQHRFGVAQRAALRDKGENPHLLVMTATPIPRSLALTVYGDLDLSVMDEMPPGRQPVETHIIYPTERERVYTLIRSQIELGHQAFIIYPLVEQGDNDDILAAVQEQDRLQYEVFPNLKVGLLHGRLRPDEKEGIMRAFRDKEYDILVSTSVIEVGVDIPNATVMLIEGANRFGLAQLHQFRGRVGRGSEKSYCILIPESGDEAENERLLAMKSTNDGFELAEYDLNQRGPGEFLGTRQSGFTDLRLANITDVRLIEKARRYAQQVFDNDPDLSAPEHQRMLEAFEHFWPSKEGDIS